MIGLLAVAIIYTVVGGMVAVVVTNYLQFLVIGVSSLTVSALVLWTTPWTDLTKGLQAAYHAGMEYRRSDDVKRNAAQERVDAVAKSEGPEAADVLREDLRRQKGEVLRHDARQLAAQYVLVDTAAAMPQVLTMGNPVNPAAQRRGRSGMAHLAVFLRVFRGGDLADGSYPRAEPPRTSRPASGSSDSTRSIRSVLFCCPACGPWARTCFSARPAGCPKASVP